MAEPPAKKTKTVESGQPKPSMTLNECKENGLLLLLQLCKVKVQHFLPDRPRIITVRRDESVASAFKVKLAFGFSVASCVNCPPPETR